MHVTSSQQSAAEHLVRALVTTMGCQQNDLVQQLALQNNQHHMNLVATIVTAITKATQAAERQRPIYAAAQPPQEPRQAPYRGAARDGGWYGGLRWTWLAIPRWNGNTNDQHADNWAADAVPDNTQAYADGSNNWAQAAHTIDQAIDASWQAPDTPMTGMQMLGPTDWPAVEVPGVPAVQVPVIDAEVPVINAEVPEVIDAEVPAVQRRQINQDENH